MPYGPSKSNQAANAAKQPVQFTLADAQRIAHVVAKVEGDRRSRKGSSLPRAAGGGGGGVELATFTGSWWKNTSNKITFVADTSSTATAQNVFANIASRPGVVKCAVAMSGTTYVLVAAECT